MSRFETEFDSPLGEVDYRISMYQSATDAAGKTDDLAAWEKVRETIEDLLEDLRVLDHRIAGKL
jgi:hypothetical protein